MRCFLLQMIQIWISKNYLKCLNPQTCGPESHLFSAGGSNTTTNAKLEDFHRTMDFLDLFHRKFNFQQRLF